MHARLNVKSNLFVVVNVSANGFVHPLDPAISWQLNQGVSLSSFNDSWNGLNLTPALSSGTSGFRR